jgi:hypothetical protein
MLLVFMIMAGSFFLKSRELEEGSRELEEGRRKKPDPIRHGGELAKQFQITKLDPSLQERNGEANLKLETKNNKQKTTKK